MLKRWWWVFLVMAGIGPLLGLLTAAVIIYVMPKQYESNARIEVMRGQWNSHAAMTPQVLKTECETIRSHRLLGKVIENLDLTNTWGMDRESTLKTLDSIVTTAQVKGADLIVIRVRHTDKEEARDIAAEVVRSYKDYREEIENREVERVAAPFKKAIMAQEAEVEARRKRLAEVVSSRSSGGAEDADGGVARKNLETEQETLTQIMLKLISEPMGCNLTMPYEGIIVHDDPEIGQRPVSPSVPLNLVLGTALGLLLALLLGLPVMWVLERCLPKKVAA